MRGLILNYQHIRYRGEGGDVNPAGRDTIYYYGVLENNQSFVWEISEVLPLAFTTKTIDEAEWSRLGIVGESEIDGWVDFRKTPVNGYFFSNQKTQNEFIFSLNDIDKMHWYQYDINLSSQYLIRNKIGNIVDFKVQPIEEPSGVMVYKGISAEDVTSLSIFTRDGNSNVKKLNQLFYRDQAEGNFFSLKVISLDIETDTKSGMIYSIALYGKDYQKVLMVSDKTADLTKDKGLDWLVYCANEREMLVYFANEIQRVNPQIFIGWYVLNFDFAHLIKRFEKFDLPFNLGVGGRLVESFKTERGRDSIIRIPGRVVLDGLWLFRRICPDLPNYKLNTVGQVLLNEKKIIEATDKEKIDEINRLFKEDKVELGRYNLQDTKLVYDLFEKYDGIRFFLIRSLLSGCGMEKMELPNEVLDHYSLPTLYAKKIATYASSRSKSKFKSNLLGEEFKRGLYEDVYQINFKDLYSFVMLSYRIDPLGMVRAQNANNERGGIDKSVGEESAVLSTARGYMFHKREHILPQIIFDLALKVYCCDGHQQVVTTLERVWEAEISQILKALSNSYSRFFIPGLMDAVCSNVQFVMEQIKVRLEESGKFEAFYYDNEVMMVHSTKKGEAGLIGKEIKSCLESDKDFFKKILPLGKVDHDIFPRVSNIVHYPKLFLVSKETRLLQKSEVIFRALRPKLNGGGENEHEYITSDSKREEIHQTSLFIDQVIKIILESEPSGMEIKLEEYFKSFKEDLNNGVYDEHLVYEKKLQKDLSEYTSTTGLSPQVVAAKKIEDEIKAKKKMGINTRRIKYWETVGGPEPVSKLASEINYTHYLEKEFTPALESLLENTEFDGWIRVFKAEDFQASLF